MPSADFAAAQQRIAARRAQRAATQRRQQDENSQQSSALALSRLPFPFARLSSTALSAWDAVKGRSGTRPEFRVGQVDAELLDEELLSLLKEQVGEGLKYFSTHITDSYSAEMLLALRLVLFKLSIWDQNASYGAHLQGLRYTDARSSAPNRPPPKPWQKIAYGALTVGGRYAWSKWEDHLLSSSEDYARPQSPGLKWLGRLSELAGSAHDIASLASFLVFLVNGRYRTITDRLLRLRLAPTSHSTSREVSFEYLNRQLVWHAFTEFLLFLLPLVGISRWRRILGRSWRKLRSALLSLLGRSSTRSSPSNNDAGNNPKTGELSFLPERTCAICYRDANPLSTTESDMLASSASLSGGGGVLGSATTDITNPYETLECACLYCFACIAQRLAHEEGQGWPCLRCGALVTQCKPWSGDIIEPHLPRPSTSNSTSNPHSHSHHDDDDDDRPSTAKSVGFAPDPTLPELTHIPPIPDSHDFLSPHTAAEQERGRARGAFDLANSLFTERSEWARASVASESGSRGSSGIGSGSGSDGGSDGDSDSGSEDQQSEEYDEDEEEEGQELTGFS